MTTYTTVNDRVFAMRNYIFIHHTQCNDRHILHSEKKVVASQKEKRKTTDEETKSFIHTHTLFENRKVNYQMLQQKKEIFHYSVSKRGD